MTLKELQELVHQLIGRAKTEEAINAIIKWAREQHQDQLKTDATLLKENLTTLNREKRLGILSNSEVNLRQNKINYGILDLLNNSDSGTPITSIPPIKPLPTPSILKILMLTANPAGTTKLNLDKEYATITEKLQGRQDQFNIIIKKAVSGDEFREFTQQGKPDILHFSGHGTEGKYAGIIVQNDDKNEGTPILVSGLKALFKYFKRRFPIKVVLLNACHTEKQAAAIAEYVDYVIGTNVAIGDKAASAFSSGFYFQLAEDDPINIEDAFDSGRTAAVVRGAKEENFVIYRKGELIEV